jgi:luciferase family oxidoreductase group 1
MRPPTDAANAPVTVPLSVLDTQWPGHLGELLTSLEEMGYHRYWASEHHSPRQSASPTLIAALAAGLTDRIRIGTAGVLLRLTSAMRVAEDFAVLELYFPGRVDLGLAAAGPGQPYERHYAADVAVPDADGYAERLRRLVGIVRRGIESEATLVPVGPALGPSASTPQLWLCGKGAASAALAGSLGLRFAYHEFLAANGGQAGATEVIRAYRSSFAAHSEDDVPYVAVAGFGCCALTLREAEAEWRGFYEGAEPATATFLGTPEICADTLSALAARFGADELVVDSFTTSLSTRLSSLGLLASTLR